MGLQSYMRSVVARNVVMRHIAVFPRVAFFLNNQPDVLINQIYPVIRLYVFRASSLPIIRSFLLYIRHWLSFVHVSDYRFQADSGWNCSILNLLGSGHQKPA
jgi:hypothetical protein